MFKSVLLTSSFARRLQVVGRTSSQTSSKRDLELALTKKMKWIVLWQGQIFCSRCVLVTNFHFCFLSGSYCILYGADCALERKREFSLIIFCMLIFVFLLAESGNSATEFMMKNTICSIKQNQCSKSLK